MSDPAQAPSAQQHSAPATAKTAAAGPVSKSGRRPAIVAAIGAVLVTAAIGLVAMKADIGIGSIGLGNASQSTLSFVAQGDLGAAASTLTPSAAAALVEEAQRCKIPLATVVLSKGTAPLGSTVRIRSGNYVSPFFTITDAVQRIAVPYPAPYGSGAGAFVIEGSANGAVLGLAPARTLTELPGSQSIPVVWRAVSPC